MAELLRSVSIRGSLLTSRAIGNDRCAHHFLARSAQLSVLGGNNGCRPVLEHSKLLGKVLQLLLAVDKALVLLSRGELGDDPVQFIEAEPSIVGEAAADGSGFNPISIKSRIRGAITL